MPLVAKDTGGGDYTPVPQGTHLAICNMVVDLGLQETTFNNEKSTKRQCFIRWELPNERIDWTDKDGNKRAGPMSVGKTYTLSLSEKANLRKDLQAWRGKAFTEAELAGFDLFVLLGIPCQVTIVHAVKGDKTYANVAGLAGWPKGMERPKATENIPVRYSADEAESYADLPDWLREKIAKQVIPQKHDTDPGPAPDSHDVDDEIPF